MTRVYSDVSEERAVSIFSVSAFGSGNVDLEHFDKSTLEQPRALKLHVRVVVLVVVVDDESSFPLCTVFTLIYPKQTTSLDNTVLQLFCIYYSQCI